MNLLTDLAQALGEANVLIDADQRTSYEVDWTGRFRGRASAIARPSDSSQVAAVLAACRRADVAVVAQGGNTGLVGGGIPRDGSVLLTTKAMEGIEIQRGQLLAGAGVPLAEAQQAALSLGERLAIDIASRDSATVGGLLATNARGAHAFRFGPMERQVGGVEAVLADGTVVEDLDGTDGWKKRLAGSEGTLAVITRLVLNLHPLPKSVTTAMVGFESIDLAVNAFASLDPSQLEAAEIMTRRSLQQVASYFGIASPVDQAAVAIFEASGANGLDLLAPVLDQAAASAIAQDGSERQRLWRWRHAHTEAIDALGVHHKLDVRLAPDRLNELCEALERLPAECFVFGHLGDGGVHINAVGPDPADDSFDAAVLKAVAALGGSIVGEHGVGASKSRWLSLSESPDWIEALRAIKNDLDPDGLLNPGVRIPDA